MKATAWPTKVTINKKEAMSSEEDFGVSRPNNRYPIDDNLINLEMTRNTCVCVNVYVSREYRHYRQYWYRQVRKGNWLETIGGERGCV